MPYPSRTARIVAAEMLRVSVHADLSVFSSGATTTTNDFLYTVNTTGYTGGGTGLDAVAFKVADEANIVSSTLLNPTNGFGQRVLGDLAAASGCSGGSSCGFIRSAASAPVGVGHINYNTH